MKQNYTEPNIKIRTVRNWDVIATSDIFIGDDIPEGTTEAPHRNADWDSFEK